jgi:hypothetical protein
MRMAHGYLRDYDEDRGDDRERRRDEDRERGWRGSGWSDRDLGSRRDAGGDRNSRFMLGNNDRDRRFRSGQDDHYLSWRDKQMDALDRDYADYCREREQQFHSDFDNWRSQRRENQGPLRTGMTQTAQTGDPTGELELSDEMRDPRADQPDPMETATLGAISSRKR